MFNKASNMTGHVQKTLAVFMAIVNIVVWGYLFICNNLYMSPNVSNSRSIKSRKLKLSNKELRFSRS